MTNAVKHFKWTAKGILRVHSKPSRREVRACRPWFETELEVSRPHVLVCLGSTAAQALLRPDFRVTVERGAPVPTILARHALATIQPSLILRQRTGDERERAMHGFVADLTVARRLAGDR